MKIKNTKYISRQNIYQQKSTTYIQSAHFSISVQSCSEGLATVTVLGKCSHVRDYHSFFTATAYLSVAFRGSHSHTGTSLTAAASYQISR